MTERAAVTDRDSGGRRLLWGVDADAVATLCSMRLEVSATLLRRPADSAAGRFTGHDAVADASLVHRLTAITPEVSLELPGDRVGDPAELVAHAADAGIRIGTVLPDVSARRGRPLPLCHPDTELAGRALVALRRAAGVAVDVRARRLLLRLRNNAPYPGRDEAKRRIDQLADVLAGLRRQLPADVSLVVDYAVDDPYPVRRSRPDWQTALSLAAAAGPGTKVLLDPAPLLDEDPELSITTLRAADRLAGVLLGRGVRIDRPFALFLAMIDAAEGGVLVRGRRCPVPFVVALAPEEEPGIEATLRTVSAVQEAAAKAMLLDRAAWRAAQAADDPHAAIDVLLAAYETEATPLLTAVRAALGVPADPLATYRELCRDTHRAVERQRSLLRAALRLGDAGSAAGSVGRVDSGSAAGRVVMAGAAGVPGAPGVPSTGGAVRWPRGASGLRGVG
ncbi:hypothetical protein [Cryptosporangium minutisporangium]|uniref:Uncharacterized protein n=1 Tax=Cryptosporangium minutisporangium TaxID=113569 RepID=A0ABP6SWN7_9ACTN